jgi:hypothetical protein
MKCIIEIDLENAAFFDEEDHRDLADVHRILTKLSKEFLMCASPTLLDKRKLFDYNGNQVGECRIAS